jgi:ubiquinone/menaquinone biosynthesis C-methylase UbiE
MDPITSKKYWDERAITDKTFQSTTKDYYLRELECRVVTEAIDEHHPSTVIDLGCGDAWTTIKIATSHKNIMFAGYDYSEEMIKNAKHNIAEAGISNLTLQVRDVLQPSSVKADLVFTTRCLINLQDWTSQKRAINNIYDLLNKNGIFVFVENFVEGNDNFNRIREEFGLEPIPMRDHNVYFYHKKLLSFVSNKFKVIKDVNISSSYYLVSRIIYSKICQANKVEPNYFDPHHSLATKLPFCGECGPIRMLCLKKIK